MTLTQSRYSIADTTEIITPAMIVFADLIENNLDEMVRVAGDPRRLRPHCKTHKMREVIQLELARGITRHKAATFAEAEMLATAGVKDIFLAYNLVGVNIRRASAFLNKFPQVALAVTADHAVPVESLGREMSAAGQSIHVVLDIDTGQHRTGLEVGTAAKDLYQRIANTPGLKAGGLHLYDGQNHQTDLNERRQAVVACWNPVTRFRDELVDAGFAVPRIVCGGTGSFPVFAELDDRTIELSPGTCVFHDMNYAQMFPDLNFTPAALLLTRVISRPTANRITLDLGYKAVASDPPAGNRLTFLALPDAKAVLQNEEHLVLETSEAGDYQPGDELLAVPRHVCPTSALHREVFVIRDGRLTERWTVAARDRYLTI